MTPESSLVRANGIDHHVLTWNPGGGTTIVLAHGFLDFAWSYARLAPLLAARGARVLAFDWRGHGESSWVGDGGYYHFADYVLDLDELLPQLSGEPPHLVGHSMGSTAAALFAGTNPAALRTLTLIEGLGVPAHAPGVMPDRYGAFLRSVKKVRAGAGESLPSLDDAAARLRGQHPKIDDAWARFLAEKGTVPRAAGRHAEASADTGLRWRFDPLHRTTSPTPFQVEGFHAFLARIAVPTLYVCASDGYRLPDEAERLTHLRGVRVREYEGTGHMIHWFAPETLAADIADLAGLSP
jgi:pimeloyl-ACP methyl ester carboxylesterase